MSFNANIPQTTDKIPQSYGQLRANFKSIALAFARNHVALSREVEDGAGKHRLLTMQPKSDPVTGATEIALYNKVVGLNPPALFYMPNNAQTPINMTYPSLVTGLQSTDPDVYFARQYSFIAGPFVVYGGLLKAVTDGQVITLLPSTNLIHVGLIIANTQAGFFANAIAKNITTNSFTLSVNSVVSPFDIYYFAVGV